MALPLIFAVTACGSSTDSKGAAALASNELNKAEPSAVPQAAQTNNEALGTDSETVRFGCLGLNSGQYDTEITLSDFAVGGDHMGPMGTYTVAGENEFKGAKGFVRVSNLTGDDSGDEYEFVDGKLGQLQAKIQPSSQGFFNLVIGDKGAQCEKEGADN